jgi:hypothetical protein
MDEKQKQLAIVRQSQLKFVLDWSKHIGVKLNLTEQMRIATALTYYCIDGYNKDTMRMLEEADKLILEKFKEE